MTPTPAYFAGLDLGQAHDYTALVVPQTERVQLTRLFCRVSGYTQRLFTLAFLLYGYARLSLAPSIMPIVNATPPDRNGCAPPSLAGDAPWWGRISSLWLMCVPIMVVMYSLWLGIVPHDFWWHARAGGIIATTGHVPRTNLFSSSLPADTPYVYQSWISEWLFYELLKHAGLAWIVVLRSLCMAAAFAVMIWAGYRRALRVVYATAALVPGEMDTVVARMVAGGALIVFILCAPNMEVRPQIFSVPLFALFIAVLFEWPCLAGLADVAPVRYRHLARLIAVLVVAMGLWANLHGAFCTGLIVLATFLGGEAIYAVAGRAGTDPAPLAPSALRALAWLLAGSALAGLVNPQGYGVYLYVMKLAGDPPSQKYISEWQSPTLGNAIHDLFFLSPCILAALAWFTTRTARDTAVEVATPAWGRFGVRPAELLMLAATAIMTWRDVRSLVWYALLYLPVFCGCGAAALVHWRRTENTSPAEAAPRSIYIVNAVMGVVLLLLIVPSLPWVRPYVPLPNSFQARFAPTPSGTFPLGFSGDPPLLLDRRTPVEALAYLRRHPPRGRLFTEMGYGSYVIWMLYPAIKPSSDTRVELYPLQFWDDYFRLSRGPADAASWLKAAGYTDALIDTTTQSGLVKRLNSSPNWRLVFRRGPSRVFRRTG